MTQKLEATPHKARLAAWRHICTTSYVRWCLDPSYMGGDLPLHPKMQGGHRHAEGGFGGANCPSEVGKAD